MTLPGHKDWIWVQCGDIKTARQVSVGNPPELHFFNCDFEKIHSTSISDLKSVEAALQSAGDKYANRDVSWSEYDESAVTAAKESGKKFVMLAFVSDRPDSLETLENFAHKAIVKFHDKILFMKTEYIKDSEEAKTWNVMSTPALLVVDPSKEGAKRVVARAGGKQSVKAIRNLIVDGLKKVEASKATPTSRHAK